MSVCVCWGGVGGGGGVVGVGIKVVNLFYLSSYIYPDYWKRYCQMDLSRPTVYFSAKISKVAIIKTKSATIAFFSSPPFLLLPLPFLLSFSFVTVILEILGVKKPAIWNRFTQMTANNLCSNLFKFTLYTITIYKVGDTRRNFRRHALIQHNFFHEIRTPTENKHARIVEIG